MAAVKYTRSTGPNKRKGSSATGYPVYYGEGNYNKQMPG